MSGLAHLNGTVRRIVDLLAGALLAADLMVVSVSVIARYVFAAPFDWADDVARGLLVALSFFGAAAAMAHGETIGITFFVNRLTPKARGPLAALVTALGAIVAGCVAVHAIDMGRLTVGQTTGAGLPLEWTFYPMGGGAACLAFFCLCRLTKAPRRDGLSAVALLAVLAAVFWALGDAAPAAGWLMLGGFLLAVAAGVPIGFALALAALTFVWRDASLPGVIFAQQMARGIDNFVLLAIPFFLLTGALMEASGISTRLIAVLEGIVGRLRGGLDVAMVLSMVLFSGMSGSKMADVAAVGTVLIPAARRYGHDPGRAVALLAASAVMAETIPPCINLILLGFVANLSIGGLFMAGLLPAALMATALTVTAVLFGERSAGVRGGTTAANWSGAALGIGLIAIIFGGFRSGFATATEISAFAALYALAVGALVLRELRLHDAVACFVQAARRAGLVLFIVAAAQAVAFVLTLQLVPQTLGSLLVTLSAGRGTWTFILLSIAILIVMGSVLEGAAALVIFGPLLIPVAARLGIAPLHFGVVLVIAMGIGLFAPPLGLGLYGACLVGDVPVERTVRPILRYLGLLLLCLVAIALLPQITMFLPAAFGYG